MYNPMSLEGKRILCLGDGVPLHNVIVEALRNNGATVLNCQNVPLDQLEEKIRDVTDNVPVDGFVFDVVHSDFRPIKFVKPSIVESVLRANYSLFIESVRCLVNHRLVSKGASIVAISSISSIRAMKTKTVFCSAKAALDAAVRCLAMELADKGIRVNSIQKGIVDVDVLKDHIKTVNDIASRLDGKPCLGVTRAEEIGNTAVFLLSDLAPTITGAAIVVDGGYTL